MSLFVARQPILDERLETSAYELLFRSGPENAFPGADGDAASLSVLSASLFHVGLERLTGGKRAFINCTRNLLLGDYLQLLPPELTVLEILETVTPDEAVVAAVRGLKERGYTIALDDFVYSPPWEPLIALADIAKIDFLDPTPGHRRALAERLRPRGLQLLAERVETREDHAQAVALGYTLFQGYFFARPAIVKAGRAPEYKMGKLMLLHELLRPDFDVERAEDIVKHDPTLTVRLLRYINSASIGVKHEIRSVRQALVLLGRRNLHRWVSVLVLTSLGSDKPAELLRQTVTRARFCELLAGASRRGAEEQSFFLTGMLSLLDALMDQPLDELLAELPLPNAIRTSLLGEEEGPLRSALGIATAFESGDWDLVAECATRLGADEEDIAALHLQAVEWADQLTAA